MARALVVSIALPTMLLFLSMAMLLVSSVHSQSQAGANAVVVEMHALGKDGVEQVVGTVSIEAKQNGLEFTPSLTGLNPGIHGFHIHENPDCGTASEKGDIVPGGAAGSHYDPDNAKQHAAPWEQGHLGDLPALYVDQEESAVQPVFKSGLMLSDVHGRALIIHEDGDNYDDEPQPLGGGGDRSACGVIP
jgi:Cu-Zn family superoxide dismutase